MKQKQQPAGEHKIKILIVDDHPIVRQGLTELINQEKDFCVCASVENAYQAINLLTKQQVDFAIVDIAMEGMNGIQLTEQIKLKYPDLPVLILSMYDDIPYAKRALRAGASGYVVKHEAAESIITAIRQILRGEIHVCERITTKWRKN